MNMRRRFIVAVAAVGCLCTLPSSGASASGDSSGSEGVPSVDVREPEVESVGINVVAEGAESRIARDVRTKVSSRSGLLASCYARSAARRSDPESVVTVDWTITTAGEPVGFTVFTSMGSAKACIRRTLSDLTFAHLEDTHPRARVRLRFQ